MDVSYFIQTILQLIPVFFDALRILILSILFGTLLGIVVAKQKLSGKRALLRIGEGYTTFIRCVPSIVLLYVVYYGLPKVFWLFGVDTTNWDRSVYIIIAFALFCGASLSEVFRSSYLSIDRGQREAGISVGMTEGQTFFRVMLPQMVRTILPPLGNSVIAVLNESSLGFAIGYMDILGRAKLIGNQTYGAKNVEIYFAAGVLYWSASIAIGRCIYLLEKRSHRKFIFS